MTDGCNELYMSFKLKNGEEINIFPSEKSLKPRFYLKKATLIKIWLNKVIKLNDNNCTG